MKWFSYIKINFSLLLVLLLTVNVYAQEKTKHSADSLQRAWQLHRDSIAKVNRMAFFKEFANFPMDTSGTINISSLNLEVIPNLSQFCKINTIDASRNKLKKVRSKDINIDSLTRLNLENNNI